MYSFHSGIVLAWQNTSIRTARVQAALFTNKMCHSIIASCGEICAEQGQLSTIESGPSTQLIVALPVVSFEGASSQSSSQSSRPSFEKHQL